MSVVPGRIGRKVPRNPTTIKAMIRVHFSESMKDSEEKKSKMPARNVMGKEVCSTLFTVVRGSQ
jgi:hypothetical protein